MKKARQADLVNIINTKSIKTQEEITSELMNIGYAVTQATVSRDIKELKIVKIVDENGKTKYTVDKNIASKSSPVAYLSEMKNFILEIKSACNIIVIKTTSGMAQGVAATVDELKFDEILGTIAGDDTIMIACRDFLATKRIDDYLSSHLF